MQDNISTPTITMKELNTTYTKLGILGSGGEALVYKVHNTASEVFALRLDEEGKKNLKSRNPLHERLKKSSKYCPHLMRIKKIFWVQRRNYAYSQSPSNPIKGIGPFGGISGPKPTRFFDETFEHDLEAKVFHHEGMLMPVAEGEVSSDIVKEMYGKQIPEVSQIYWDVQRAIFDLQLEQIGLVSHDDKQRNFVYFQTKDDRFQGKPLAQFSSWQYQIGHTQIHIPIGPYNPRRVDFGGWRVAEAKIPTEEDLQKAISRIAKNNEVTESEIYSLLEPPTNQDPNKIIKINLNSRIDFSRKND